MIYCKKNILLASLAATSLIHLSVQAEQTEREEIESIIVRGTFSETPLSEVASSITLWNQQQIEQRQPATPYPTEHFTDPGERIGSGDSPDSIPYCR